MLTLFDFSMLINMMAYFRQLLRALISNPVMTLRFLYISCACILVINGFRRTFQKIKEGNTVVSLTEIDYPKFLYPSVTWCDLFPNGGRDIVALQWFEKWKTSGKEISFFVHIS